MEGKMVSIPWVRKQNLLKNVGLFFSRKNFLDVIQREENSLNSSQRHTPDLVCTVWKCGEPTVMEGSTFIYMWKYQSKEQLCWKTLTGKFTHLTSHWVTYVWCKTVCESVLLSLKDSILQTNVWSWTQILRVCVQCGVWCCSILNSEMFRHKSRLEVTKNKDWYIKYRGQHCIWWTGNWITASS